MSTLIENTVEMNSTRPNNGYENVPRFFVTVNDALLAEKPKKMTEVEYISWLEGLINKQYPSPQDASAKGCLEFLKQVHDSGRKLGKYHVFYFATRGGHRKIMDWVEETFGKIDNDRDTGFQSCGVAAAKGRLDLVEYLFGRGFRIDISQYPNILCNDHLHVVKWMIERKINLFYPNDNMESLLQDTALNVLEFFLKEQKKEIPQGRIDWAARNQQVEALKVLAKYGYYPSKLAFDKLFNGVHKEEYIGGKLETWYKECNIAEKATNDPEYALVYYFE